MKRVSKKRVSKKRVSKKRVSKKRVSVSKKRVSKKRVSVSKKRVSVSKKRVSKKRVSKKRVSKKRVSKKRVSKKRVSKKRVSKKRVSISKKRVSKTKRGGKNEVKRKKPLDVKEKKKNVPKGKNENKRKKPRVLEEAEYDVTLTNSQMEQLSIHYDLVEKEMLKSVVEEQGMILVIIENLLSPTLTKKGKERFSPLWLDLEKDTLNARLLQELYFSSSRLVENATEDSRSTMDIVNDKPNILELINFKKVYNEFVKKIIHHGQELKTELLGDISNLLPHIQQAYHRIFNIYFSDISPQINLMNHLYFNMFREYLLLPNTMEDDVRIKTAIIMGSGPMILKLYQRLGQNKNLSTKVRNILSNVYQNLPGVHPKEMESLKNIIFRKKNSEEMEWIPMHRPWLDKPYGPLPEIYAGQNIIQFYDNPMNVASIGQIHRIQISEGGKKSDAIFKFVKPRTILYYLTELIYLGIDNEDPKFKSKIEDNSGSIEFYERGRKFLNDLELLKKIEPRNSKNVQNYLSYQLMELGKELDFQSEYDNIALFSKLYNHKNISTIESVFASNEPFPHIIMTLAKGDSLKTIITKNPEALPSIKLVFGHLIQMWLSESLLKSGYFHGDLHPGNMMIKLGGKDSEHIITLIDFGNVGKLNKREQCSMINIMFLHNKIIRNGDKRIDLAEKLFKEFVELCDIKEDYPGEFNGAVQKFKSLYRSDPQKGSLGHIILETTKFIKNLGICATGGITEFSKGLSLLEKSYENIDKNNSVTQIFEQQLRNDIVFGGKVLYKKTISCRR
jgi:predicted unusual protein kinase regulating ubiquinone biosynthesis (AarF/ABC1/UbiB family)